MNTDTCTRCNGTEVLMKADFSSFVPCPECAPKQGEISIAGR